MEEIAKDVAVVPLTMVNAYLVGHAGSWVLVDAGMPGKAETIRAAAEARFGKDARPRAIVLTHGHFDHSGSARELAELWNVKVYAHRFERPYLTGRSKYPPLDPTAPGAFSFLSRFFPRAESNLGEHLADLPPTLADVGLGEWELIDTPGHTPGHVSFFRPGDRTLLAGDAVATVNVDNLFSLISQKQQVSRPPPPATTDWEQARNSVAALSKLQPKVIAAGHGRPILDATDGLKKLAKEFPIPEYGRYAKRAARADGSGLTYLPPKPPDQLMRVTTGVAAAALLAGVGTLLLRQRR